MPSRHENYARAPLSLNRVENKGGVRRGKKRQVQTPRANQTNGRLEGGTESKPKHHNPSNEEEKTREREQTSAETRIRHEKRKKITLWYNAEVGLVFSPNPAFLHSAVIRTLEFVNFRSSAPSQPRYFALPGASGCLSSRRFLQSARLSLNPRLARSSLLGAGWESKSNVLLSR